jgi:hypothetical protein
MIWYVIYQESDLPGSVPQLGDPTITSTTARFRGWEASMPDPFSGAQNLYGPERETLIEALSGMLKIQKVFAGGYGIEDGNGHINRKAIGYIYGFVDSALTALGQDMSDGAVIFFPVLSRVLGSLFPGFETRYMDFLFEHAGHDEAVTAGVMRGGQEYIDFFVKQRSDSRTAMGFARYLMGVDDRKENN